MKKGYHDYVPLIKDVEEDVEVDEDVDVDEARAMARAA